MKGDSAMYLNIRQLMIGAGAVALSSALQGSALAAPPANWSEIPTKTVTLFYPGQAGYDWLRSPAHKRANKKVIAGDACVSCHEGEEADIGNLIVTGDKLEPAPIEGKNGTIEVKVQAAYDAENLYFRFQWPTNMGRPGDMHDMMRFDGEKWVFFGGPRSSGKVRDGSQPPLYEDRLAIMLDDGSVPGFKEQGCWLTCHTGMRDMPDEPTKEQVQAHPVLGKDGVNAGDIRKYLPDSRTDPDADWSMVKSAEEIAELKALGKFVDLMQWRAARSNPVGMADDGYVLEYRLFDAGKNPFSWNVDRTTMTPKFMFDAAKVGSKSLTMADIDDASKQHAIIKEQNAVPYDANAGWKEGDVLPGRLLTRTGVEGSAGDNSNAKGVWKDNSWTLEFTRKLDSGHPEDDKILKEGGVYTVGFAIHDDNVTTRFHHVGFPLSLGLGAPADIEATKVK
jgi:hypothetical protein